MELVKSRALTATLSTRVSSQPGAPEFDIELDKLSSRLDALEYKSYAGDGTAAIDKERTRIQEERASLLERSRISDPRWRSLSEPVPFDLKKFLRSLAGRDQAALSLFIHDDDVTSVLLLGGRCEVGRTPLSPNTKKAFNVYQENLQAKSPDPQQFDPSEALKLTADQIVPRVLLEKAISAKSLVVVPHGMLHLLPWAALKLGQKRLFEYVPVGVLPNLSCITVLFSESSKRPRVALIGAPDYTGLPGIAALALAPYEIATIADTYRAHAALICEPYALKEATEERFWLLSQDKAAANGILHVVCHGDFVTGDPMSSGLLLSNGKVDATELIRKRLPFDEVILSACATGQRPVEVQGIPLTGDDIVGLPGALLEAGARSVLVSIPAARDDAAMHFMTTYHEYRVEGTPPLPALQKTQIDMLEGQVYEPELWAGFTAYGCQ